MIRSLLYIPYDFIYDFKCLVDLFEKKCTSIIWFLKYFGILIFGLVITYIIYVSVLIFGLVCYYLVAVNVFSFLLKIFIIVFNDWLFAMDIILTCGNELYLDYCDPARHFLYTDLSEEDLFPDSIKKDNLPNKGSTK